MLFRDGIMVLIQSDSIGTHSLTRQSLMDECTSKASKTKFDKYLVPLMCPIAPYIVHDFFESQPVIPSGSSFVYLLRFILHDWSDKYCGLLLKQLREAARPDTRLVIVDYIVPCIAGEPPGYETEDLMIPGITDNVSPWRYPDTSLLPNLGHGNARPYLADLQVSSLLL